MSKSNQIVVQNTPITIIKQEKDDYISLTDMARGKDNPVRAADVIKNWLRNRNTLEFLGTWEIIHNPNFKVVEVDHFKIQAGLHTFVLSASEWITKTNAIGIVTKKGKYGGTYAHKDIAFEFGSAIFESRAGFEPANQGFADPAIRPLWYRDNLGLLYHRHQYFYSAICRH